MPQPPKSAQSSQSRLHGPEATPPRNQPGESAAGAGPDLHDGPDLGDRPGQGDRPSPPEDADRSATLTRLLKLAALDAGFSLAAAAPAINPPHYEFFCQWLEQGMAGGMEYLPRRRQAYSHPRWILDGATSVLMLGLNYAAGASGDLPPLHGRVARYAWSEQDYHDRIHHRLKTVIRRIQAEYPQVAIRGVVDTAPLLERDFARLAGLGWVGKNTMLISKRIGSYFFLAALVLDVPLEYDQPHLADHCGSCTRCLEACPTQAFPAPGVLDARRCISYLTIEQQGPVSEELRSGIGDWWFGCDICQEVCPWNRHAPGAGEPDLAPLPERQTRDLLSLFDMDEGEFRRRYRSTPHWRPKRVGALRNAAYVLGNQQNEAAVPTLQRALACDPDPVVRGAAAWALGQIGGPAAAQGLQRQADRESDPQVQQEIQSALWRGCQQTGE